MSFFDTENNVKISKIRKNYFSLHPSDFRSIKMKNKNKKLLYDLIEEENVGTQVEVENYTTQKTSHYLINISCMANILLDETKGENIPKKVYDKSEKKLKKGDVLISRNATLGKVSYINKDILGIANGGLSFFKVKEEYKYYLMAFFISSYGEEALINACSGGGTQKNAKREDLLNIEIPFPNEENSAFLINYISNIVLDIIEKEEQIIYKNRKINKIIEDELLNNQNITNLTYNYPKISQIKKEKRLDVGIYKEDFKKNIAIFENYKNSSLKIKNYSPKFYSGATPIFKDIKNSSLPIFVRPTEMDFNRTYLKIVNIHTKDNIKIHNQEGIIVPRKGGTYALYKPKDMNVTINDSLKFLEVDKDCLFIANIITSNYVQKYLDCVKSKANGGGLREEHIANILIPQFPDNVKNLINVEYFNEGKSNQEKGIYQLNLELFEQKDKLEKIIFGIVMDNINEKFFSFNDYLNKCFLDVKKNLESDKFIELKTDEDIDMFLKYL